MWDRDRQTNRQTDRQTEGEREIAGPGKNFETLKPIPDDAIHAIRSIPLPLTPDGWDLRTAYSWQKKKSQLFNDEATLG